jgi:S1-C subfamily serine protease
VFVTRVSPGNPAASAGIEADDLILGIDGVGCTG